MRRLFILIVFCSSSAAVADEAPETEAVREWCAEAGVPGKIELGSRTLMEIPDVTDDSIRRMNLQLSIGCFLEVEAALNKRAEEIETNPQLWYVVARFVWMTAGSYQVTEQVIGGLIERHPDFVSGRVLLAGLRIEQGRLDEAAEILASLGADAADRLWVYLGDLRIQAKTRSDGDAIDRLYEVVTNSDFPPNAREAAFEAIRRSHYNDPDFQVPLYRARLSYRSPTSLACKLQSYAFLLADRFQMYEEAIEQVEPVLRDAATCSSRHNARIALGYAYLMLASEIAGEPTAANQALVERADELLAEGGYEQLSSFLFGRPNLQVLEPFLLARLDPDAEDQSGRTRLCNATMLLDAQAVLKELERGANPNGLCSEMPLVVRLAEYRYTDDRRSKQEHILRLLLQYGGKYENFSNCNPAVSEGCGFYLYPIFQEYGIE